MNAFASDSLPVIALLEAAGGVATGLTVTGSIFGSMTLVDEVSSVCLTLLLLTVEPCVQL